METHLDTLHTLQAWVKLYTASFLLIGLATKLLKTERNSVSLLFVSPIKSTVCSQTTRICIFETVCLIATQIPFFFFPKKSTFPVNALMRSRPFTSSAGAFFADPHDSANLSSPCCTVAWKQGMAEERGAEGRMTEERELRVFCEGDEGCPHLSGTTVIKNQSDSLFSLAVQKPFWFTLWKGLISHSSLFFLGRLHLAILFIHHP